MPRTRLFSLLIALFAALMPLQGRAAGSETLTWEECLREAAASNPELKVAGESVRQAEAQRKIDRAELYPSLSLEAGVRRYGTIADASSPTASAASPTALSSTQTGSGDDSSLSLSLSASQLLYDGGKSRNQVRSSTETIKAERYAADEVSADTRFTLRSAFIELLKAQEQIGIAREIVERRSRNLRLIGLRYQAGREHLGSLGKARADEAKAKFDLQSASRNLETARLRLETVLGRRTYSSVRVAGAFVIGTPVGAKPDFEAIVTAHPSFRELAARKDASRYSVEAARRQFSPQLSLSSSLGNSSFDYGDLDEEGLDWQVGLAISVPIYQGGAGSAGVARARSVMYQLDAKAQAARLSLMRSLQERWSAMKDAVENVSVQKRYLDAAGERARIAEAQYSSGLLSFNEWIILEDAVVSAKMSYLNARADMLTEEARWIQAKGGTLEANR